MKKAYFYFILLNFSTLVSCTLYTENNNVLNNDETEIIEPTVEPKKAEFVLVNSNNLNVSTLKLEDETKKIESEISTLLEAF